MESGELSVVHHLSIVAYVYTAFGVTTDATALKVVDDGRLSVIGRHRMDRATVLHLQDGIHDNASVGKYAVGTGAGAVGSHLSARIDAVPIHLEAYAVLALLGECFK